MQTWPSQRRMAHGHKVSLVDLLPDRMDLFGRFWPHVFFQDEDDVGWNFYGWHLK